MSHGFGIWGRCAIATVMMLPLANAQWANAKEEIWRHDTAATLGKGRLDGVVLSGNGRVGLARVVAKVGELEAARVWDLAETADGTLWAATGDQGRIFRYVRETGNWVIAEESGDGQVFSLAARGDRVAAGTGPGGLVIELDGTGARLASGRPDASVQYIWDLAYQSDGTLLAATGPSGQLWKKPPGGAWAVLFDAPQPHLLCLLTGQEGEVYVGTDSGAIVYRVAADGRATVLLDAPQEEIRVLRHGDEGSILAGTASESLGGGAGARSTMRSLDQAPPNLVRVAFRQGTAKLKAGAAGENVVYRIELESGTTRELHRLKGLILALANRAGVVEIGTGPEGRLIELRDDGEDATPLVRLDHGQILSLLRAEDESLILGVGDPGGVYRLESAHAASGTLTSEVLDAGLTARFGDLSTRTLAPPGTSVSVEVRTGAIAEPDPTWSDWITPPRAIPNGRFAQYRVRLSTANPAQTPELTAVSLAYRTLNLPPEIASITVPDLTAADGATRQSKLELKWEASDPNDDPLRYTLAVRKDDWPDWIAVNTAGPLTDKKFSWDTITLPAGRYRLRVTASDDRANSAAEALRGERTTEPFVVDHLPPVVELNVAQDGRSVRAIARDTLTRLVSAEYSLDGGDWTPAFADDGLFDSMSETLTIGLPPLASGQHVLVFRVNDAAGNPGAVDAVFSVP